MRVFEILSRRIQRDAALSTIHRPHPKESAGHEFRRKPGKKGVNTKKLTTSTRCAHYMATSSFGMYAVMFGAYYAASRRSTKEPDGGVRCLGGRGVPVAAPGRIV